jgi:hypothetical protein
MRYTLCDKGVLVTRILLVVLVVLIAAPEDATSSGAAWPRKRIVVRDHTPETWRPLVAEAVAAFNAKRGKHVPRLRYRDAGAPCRRHKRGISVCEFSGEAQLLGWTVVRPWHTPTRAIVMLGGPVGDRSDAAEIAEAKRTVCHELFHALTNAPERKVPKQEACPYNERFARKVYRTHARR